MSRAEIIRDVEGHFYGIQVACPGCRWPDGEAMHHLMPLRVLPAGETESQGIGKRDRWDWNGSFDRPTFSPSVLHDSGEHRRCHSFITDGRIKFLDDCTHDLKGQTVDLPEIES